MRINRIQRQVMTTVLGLMILGASACANGSRKMTVSDLAALKPSGQIEQGVRVIQVEAKQYAFIPDPIVVVSGEKVRLEATATDVTHGIALSGYGINRKLEPKQTETIEFTAGAPGTNPIHCTEFCGMGHFNMSGSLVVLAATQQ